MALENEEGKHASMKSNDSHSSRTLIFDIFDFWVLETTLSAEIIVGENATETDPKLVKSFEEVSAIFNFRPNRLGHALLLPESLRNVLMKELLIPVESCPTSNVMTLELAKHMGGNLIHGLKQHPQLPYWLQEEYPISIGTDDPGVFNTNATQELLLLARAWDLKESQIQRIVFSSLEHAFCSDFLKDIIRTQLAKYTTELN